MENQLKATELRCGNLLEYFTGDTTLMKVNWHSLRWVSEDETGFNLVHSPIQLTEDILVNLGFEKNGGRLTLGRFTYDSNQRRFEIEGHEYDFNGITFEASYLHQLQNVFFNLTGEELTFKN